MIGYVYVMSNPSMPGMVKIGMTKNDPRLRAKDLTTATGVPAAFKVDGYIKTDNYHQVERIAHDHFHEFRINGAREFFAVKSEDAIVWLNNFVKTRDGDFISAKKVDAHVQSWTRYGEISRVVHERRKWEDKCSITHGILLFVILANVVIIGNL